MACLKLIRGIKKMAGYDLFFRSSFIVKRFYCKKCERIFYIDGLIK